MKGLEKLVLSDNNLTDINPLKELKRLSDLDLSHNQQSTHRYQTIKGVERVNVITYKRQSYSQGPDRGIKSSIFDI